jgi:hypothetical protein
VWNLCAHSCDGRAGSANLFVESHLLQQMDAAASEAVKQFMAVAGITDRTFATSFLSGCNNNVQQAVNSYLEGSGSGAAGGRSLSSAAASARTASSAAPSAE